MTNRARVTSADGTEIGYTTTGTGPGLVVVPGVMLGAKHNEKLAGLLADSFTVHAVDRRGRGDSGPQGDDYSIDKEVEDLTAIMHETGASYVFGHSYGGLVTLQTALHHPIGRMALYEPTVSINGSFPTSFLPEFTQQVKTGNTARAMAVLIKGLQISGPIGKLPTPLLAVLAGVMMHTDLGRDIKAVLPTVPAEAAEGVRLDSSTPSFAEIDVETLLMAGTETPDWLRGAAEGLHDIMPHSELVMLPKLEHDAPQEAPEPVVEHLRRFFLADPADLP